MRLNLDKAGWIIAGIALTVVVTVLVVKRTPAPEPAAPAGFAFYYYPGLNLYYDIAHRTFVYSDDGGATWQLRTDSTEGAAENLGNHVQFYSSIPEAWLLNPLHRQQYGGVQTNFAKDTIYTPKKVADSGSRIAVADSSVGTDSSKVVRKRAGFFKRLRDRIKGGLKKKDH